MGAYGVPGDPDGMRRLAAALRKDASQLYAAKGDARRAFGRHDSDHEHVEAWQQALRPALAVLPTLAHQLEGLAAELERAATQVERDVSRARAEHQAALERTREERRP